jgi:hypothetical protein
METDQDGKARAESKFTRFSKAIHRTAGMAVANA